MTAATPNISTFKASHLRYRRRPQTHNEWRTLASELIDFSDPQQRHHEIFPMKEFKHSSSSRANEATIFHNKTISLHNKVYCLEKFPGLLYAPKSLSESVQLELAHLALSKYCETPHRTNIDVITPYKNDEYPTNYKSMWETWMDQKKSDQDKNGRHASSKQQCKHKKNEKPHRSIEKLSWATMGYHYDWTFRTYREESKSEIHEDLKILSQLCASYYDSPTSHAPPMTNDNIVTSPSLLCQKEEKTQFFHPTACIVNYYKMKSNMGGHSDDLELTFDKPVISISIGLPAIFLLGGNSKDEGPVVPILIRPGDILMLGGESRLRYHGMARVLSQNDIDMIDLIKVENKKFPPGQTNGNIVQKEDIIRQSSSTSDQTLSPNLQKDLEYVQLFLSTHRININVRQVLPDGVSQIPKTVVRKKEASFSAKRKKANTIATDLC